MINNCEGHNAVILMFSIFQSFLYIILYGFTVSFLLCCSVQLYLTIVYSFLLFLPQVEQ